jgi:hypothetical protein
MNSLTLMPVVGFEGFYEVSDTGDIFSIERTVVMKNSKTIKINRRKMSLKKTASGYLVAHLRMNGGSFMRLAHRLVLLSFSKPTRDKEIVNHKNGIKTDNRLENLEWCNKSENALHAFRVLGVKPSMLGVFKENHPVSKKIIGINVKTGEMLKFNSLTLAKDIGCTLSGISSCLNGYQKTHRGMRWEFLTQ